MENNFNGPSRDAALRLALLVDGENLASSWAERIVVVAQTWGKLTVCRVYGDVKLINGWEVASGFRMMHSGSGKNAADILLSIEGVELAHSGAIDGFVLASSDRDYAHLAAHLRGKGFFVLGLGEAKTPPSFRHACSTFIVLTTAETVPGNTASTTAQPVETALTRKIDAALKELFQTHGSPKGIRISFLGPVLHSQHGIKISATKERTWRAYLLARPELYRCDPRGPEAHVRLVRKA